ncbi:hypothetical protein I7I53_06957 [Histoplasma capsulatum var. duboisii H88]|uniref:Uncharacterized protein n=1 Tax=Ajellomyces capsulatus (strain H88) TaxID=544711 RepID=A0A8A1LFC2_AJEC8|nr:hypothetical protein I7I53_06957 [Histoplasma capsulatum var. duboisii H88]
MGLRSSSTAFSSATSSRSMSRTSCSGIRGLEAPYILWMTRRASGCLSARTSQRGVSGRKSRMESWIIPGRAPRPTIHRHPAWVVEKSQPMV